jgi:hypothetical protein
MESVMGKVLLFTARRPRRERKLTARFIYLVSYPASGLLLSAHMTSVLAVSVVLSLAHLI